MLRKVLTALAIGILTLTTALPVLAADMTGYTGWDYQMGHPRYYVNGNVATNCWIKYDNAFHYLGADGHIVPEMVMDANAAPAVIGNNYIDGSVNDLKYQIPIMQDKTDYSAAKYYYGVSNDFEAFQVLYPEHVITFAGNEQGLMDYYLSTYHCGSTQDQYLKALDGFMYSFYNTHNYGVKYEPTGTGYHKAYCGCGAYIVEQCNRDGDSGDGHEKCTVCGWHFTWHKNQHPLIDYTEGHHKDDEMWHKKK